MVCGFLPGGRARISRPASSGSSDSISCSSAVPPPKRCANSRWKWPLTTSKAASSRSRPSRLRLWIAWRSLRIASTTSSRSATSVSSRSDSSCCSSSARRLTAPSRSRSIFSRSSRRSTSADVGQRAVGLQPGVADDQMRRRVQRLVDARLDLRAGARRRRSAAPRRGRGSRALRQATGSRRSPPCRARPAGSRPPAAGRRRPCASVSASASCDSSARRRASISSGASSSACCSALGLGSRARRARRSGGPAFSARASPAAALGTDRRQPAAARLGFAAQPSWRGARIGKRRAVARRRQPLRARAGSAARRDRASRQAACSASATAAAASAWPSATRARRFG